MNTTAELSTFSFDDVFKRLRFTFNVLKGKTKSKPVDAIISPLQTICSSIGSNKPYKPLYVPEEYVKQWENYLKDNKRIETLALWYLCEKADIASDKRFLLCLQHEQINLSARSLQGIVRACHFRWDSVLKESFLKKGSILEMVRSMIVKYKRPNRVLQKWNSSLDTILSSKGPELFAGEMIKDFKTIKEHTESWAVDVQSEFFFTAMMHAVQQCRRDINRCRYLFAELLHWQLWDNSPFKKVIAEFILDDYFNNGVAKEILHKFILSDSRLGDPRLPRNNRNWIDIDADAKSRFIQWLSQLDIVFFFEHVLPKGSDPHGRKEFWLKYIKQIRASRPMLCQTDADRLKTSSFLLKDKINIDHLGKINTYNSVFLLDFGSIIAVEFSVVGASYIYTSETFKKFFPDFWSKGRYNESYFRRQENCVGRIIHTRNERWKKMMSNLLSQYGVRQ